MHQELSCCVLIVNTGSLMMSIHSGIQSLDKISEYLRVLLIVWGRNTAILSAKKLLIKQKMFVLKQKILTGHLDPALENLQQMKEKLCKL